MKQDLMGLLRSFTPENPEAYFKRIAEMFLQDIVLKFNNGKKYRITEIEVYCYYDDGIYEFKDPFAFYRPENDGMLPPSIPTKCGCCYIHPTGVDITFGKGDKVCGGVSLRTATLAEDVVNEIDKDRDISGPLYLRGNLLEDAPIGIIKEKYNGKDIFDCIEEDFLNEKIYSSPRVGLYFSRNYEDPEARAKSEFVDRPYRYMTLLKKEHKDKESIVKFLICSKEIDINDQTDLFGRIIIKYD